MAPDAPAPTYDSHGNIVRSWRITLAYDDTGDFLEVSTYAEGGSLFPEKRTRVDYEPQDIEDALRAVQIAARTLGARRLF